ncbi:MAG: hypothetical protein GY758_31220 [Fuerstiella sp.]|nr:hypothetical protein [Fuerstiella sp.]
MSKRANGEGTIYKRPDGRWRGRISLGRDKTGKRIQETVYGKTQKEVKDKLDDLKRQAKLNRKAIVAKDSLAAYLQRWLDNDVAIDRSDNTIAEYEMATRLYVTPYIGAVKLRKLDGEHLLAWQSALKKDGHSDNTRLRSIRTLRNALSRLGFFQSVLATLSEMAWVA